METVLAKWNLKLNLDKTEKIRLQLADSKWCPGCDSFCEEDAVQCDGCDVWWHYRCAGLTPEEIRVVEDVEDSKWFCAPCKDKQPKPAPRGEEPWRKVRSLGTLLGTTEDVGRRKGLAAAAMRKLYLLWPRRVIVTERRRLRLYNAFVLPTLTYNLAVQAPTQAVSDSLDAFHRRQLRHVLGAWWPDNVISNDQLYARTGARPLSEMARCARWRFLGHALRLPADTPANQAMEAYFRAREHLRRWPGRARTCLQTVLSADLQRSQDHDYHFNTTVDLCTLREVAADRTRWDRLCEQVCAPRES
jgi:hypothetical protein